MISEKSYKVGLSLKGFALHTFDDFFAQGVVHPLETVDVVPTSVSSVFRRRPHVDAVLAGVAARFPGIPVGEGDGVAVGGPDEVALLVAVVGAEPEASLELTRV